MNTIIEKIPNKIYLAFKSGFVAQAANVPEAILDEYNPVEFVNKKTLLEWAKEMLKSCDGSVAMRRAYEKLTEHIKSL